MTLIARIGNIVKMTRKYQKISKYNSCPEILSRKPAISSSDTLLNCLPHPHLLPTASPVCAAPAPLFPIFQGYCNFRQWEQNQVGHYYRYYAHDQIGNYFIHNFKKEQWETLPPSQTPPAWLSKADRIHIRIHEWLDSTLGYCNFRLWGQDQVGYYYRDYAHDQIGNYFIYNSKEKQWETLPPIPNTTSLIIESRSYMYTST